MISLKKDTLDTQTKRNDCSIILVTMEAEHRIGGKEEVQEGTQSKSSDFSTQNDPQTSCTSSALSVVTPEVMNHSDLASVALEVKDQPSTLHSPSAILGDRRTYECNQTSTGSDSDDSVEIIEVPKKPVPLICISDSETDNEDKKKSVKSKSSKREEKKMTLQEKLEEYKSKLFPIKQEGSEESASSAEKQDLTCSICLGPYDNRALLDVCFRILFVIIQNYDFSIKIGVGHCCIYQVLWS